MKLGTDEIIGVGIDYSNAKVKFSRHNGKSKLIW